VTVVTDEKRLRIAELAEAGLSVRQIAEQTGISATSVTRHAKTMGVHFDRSTTMAATAARIADGLARRAELAARLLELADAELDRLHRPHRVFAFVGGQAPAYLEHVLPQPDPAARLAIARTAATLLDRHTRLAALTGGPEEEAARSMLGDLAQGLRRYQVDAEADSARGAVPGAQG
jgi:AcrR family transcriptional regulator